MIDEIKIPKELLIKYYKNLIGQIYKLLPIAEGVDIKTKQVIYLPEEAFAQFQKCASNLLVEIYGNSGLFFQSVHSVSLVSMIRGILQEIKIDQHKKLKSSIFKCINLCNKIIEELEE